MTRPCDKCGEVPRGTDPGLSETPPQSGTFTCAFCSYWNVPPGPEREKMRATREAQAAAPSAVEHSPQYNDLVKSKCQGPCCTDPDFKPMPVVIACPECGVQHVDQGLWETKKHRTHRCVDRVDTVEEEHDDAGNLIARIDIVVEGCGFEWQPSLIHTVGVRKMR